MILSGMNNIENLKMRENNNNTMDNDETIVAWTSGQAEINFSRCTIKVLFIAKESAYKACIYKSKEIFHTF